MTEVKIDNESNSVGFIYQETDISILDSIIERHTEKLHNGSLFSIIFQICSSLGILVLMSMLIYHYKPQRYIVIVGIVGGLVAIAVLWKDLKSIYIPSYKNRLWYKAVIQSAKNRKYNLLQKKDI